MLFTLHNALKAIRHRIALSCVVVLSFWVGLFGMYIALSMLDNYLATLYTLSFKQPQFTDITELSQSNQNTAAKPITLEQLNAFLDKYDVIRQRDIMRDVDVGGDTTDGAGTRYSAVSESFSDFYNYELKEGRFFSAGDYTGGEKICVVEQKLADMGRARLGGTYTIGGEEYRVVGVIFSSLFRSYTFLPHVRPGDEGMVEKYTVMLRYGELEDRDAVQWGELPVLSESQTAAEYTAETTAWINGIMAGFVSVGAVLMLYGLINIYNIVVNRILAGSSNYGIRLACGAARGRVFLQIYAENAILALAACCIIFALDPLVNAVVRNFFEHRMGIFTVVSLLFTALAVTFAISRLSARRLMKRSIVDIIRKAPR